MKSQPHILIVEDEPAIRDMLRLVFKTMPFQLLEAESVQVARQKMALQTPDLILLDWMLPNVSGIDFIKQIREKAKTRDIPIILLTARAEEENKVKGLQVGADDYITKPFSPRELIARIQSVMRRGPLQSPDGFLAFNTLQLDTYQCQVKVGNHCLSLTSLEYRLLHFFMKHPNKVYSREELLEYIWGAVADINERSIDSQIKRLRKQLASHGYDRYLQTVRGIGYQWNQLL
jgi:two-component system, OmpR family, phosphate regulon response regulator PhoB